MNENWIPIAILLVTVITLLSVFITGCVAAARNRRRNRRTTAPVGTPVNVRPRPMLHAGQEEPRVTVGPVRIIRGSQPRPAPQRLVRRGSLTVNSSRSLWEEKGWRREGNAFVGQFRAGRRHWPGRIDVPYAGGYAAYIWNPPLRELENHPHRPCFRSSGSSRQRYNVHFHTTPSSVDHAITNIETILTEATGRAA